MTATGAVFVSSQLHVVMHGLLLPATPQQRHHVCTQNFSKWLLSMSGQRFFSDLKPFVRSLKNIHEPGPHIEVALIAIRFAGQLSKGTTN